MTKNLDSAASFQNLILKQYFNNKMIKLFEPSDVEIEREVVHRIKYKSLLKSDGGILSFLIEHLDRIDNKISILLTFNGIVLAILAILIESNEIHFLTLSLPKILLLISLFFVVISSYLCLTMIYLYGYQSSKGISKSAYLRKIVSSVVSRTKRYNFALRLNHYASALFLIYLLVGIFL